MDHPRVVSLLPSATEIVCALGAVESLVAVSHECDFPPAARGLPSLTRSRIDASGTSAQIDAAVRATHVEDALSIYAIDADALASLDPDVIVTQDLCEVCAVSLDDVRAAVARLTGRRDVRIVSLRPTRLTDILDDVVRVAEGLGRRETGESVRAELAARIDAVAARAPSERPRVITVEWLDPLMLGGTWMPELVERAGGVAVGVEAGAPAPTVSLDALVALAPDVVVIKPCGFDLERTLRERPLVDALVEALPPPTRVYLTDGNAYFNRPGPRIVDSLEILAACVHPAAFEDFATAHAAAMRAR